MFYIFVNPVNGLYNVSANLYGVNRAWFDDTVIWLAEHGLEWRRCRLTPYAHIEFPDPNTVLLFKLTFGGARENRNRH